MKRIQVLGPGCPKCAKLAEHAAAAANALGLAYQLERVTDITEIMRLGVLILPALVIDGQVKTEGMVPSPDEIQYLLTAGPSGDAG